MFVLNVYLLWAALFTTFRMIWVHRCSCNDEALEPAEQYHDFNDVPPAGAVCCKGVEDGPSWYQLVQWVLFYLAVSTAPIVLLVYWGFVYDPEVSEINFVAIAVHGLNGLLVFFDVFFSGMPMRILHFYFVGIFAVVYVIFTVIYFYASGRNFVYSVLDYDDNRAAAAGYTVLMVAAFIGGHLMTYLIYLLRLVCTTFFCLKRCGTHYWSHSETELGNKPV